MNNFTFLNPIRNNTENHSDEAMENYESWAERIKGGQHDNFGKPNNLKFGAWRRRNLDEDDNESDITPSLESWKRNHDYCYYDTDNPRAQSITKYRLEMLDLVRGMPEEAYELSLRDLVESPKIVTPPKGEEDEEDTKKTGKRKEKRGGRRISRSESMDGGLMLKMMFIPRIPSFLGGKKRKDGSKTLKSAGGKVSPKPALGDREWWNDELGARSTSGGSSSSSNSSGKGNRQLIGCYPFFQTR